MLNFGGENLATILISAGILALMLLAVRCLVKNRKHKACCNCDGNCSACHSTGKR